MIAETPSPRSGWILAAGALAFFLLAAGYWSGYLIDDAFISLRYARNLTAGAGLVFNPGERVEGYTNFLWVLLAAAAMRLGVDPMLALRFVSALASAAVLILVGRERHGLVAVAFLAGAPAFAFWAITGMETAFFAFLLFLAWTLGWRESVEGRRLGSVAVFLLLALTRPEGVALFALCHALYWLAEGRRRSALRRHAADALLFAVGYGAYFVWRLGYYGSLFPNTYHAKVTNDAAQWRTGWRAAVEWAAAHPVFAASIDADADLHVDTAGRRKLLAERETLALWGLCLAGCVYVVGIGGDFMPFFRFFLPLAPFFALVTARVLVTIARRRAVVVAAALIAVQAVTTLGSDQPERAFVAHRTTVVGTQVGRAFADLYEPDDWLAVNTAGSLPYAAGLPTIDMLGLTDEAIARHPVYVISTGWTGHRRGWGASVLARRPKAVVWYNTAGLSVPHYLGDHELADDPFFRFFYQRRTRSLEVSGERRGEVLARFFGAPFGRESRIPDLGATFEAADRPFPHTVARADAVELVWFERRADPDALWPVFDATGRDVDRFLDRVVARWRSAPAADVDPVARRRVDELCDRAAAAVERGRTAEAKELLSRASRLGARAATPRLYQYVANLAAIEGDVFLAVQAQREALRLAPESALYRTNLAALMRQPFGREN